MRLYHNAPRAAQTYSYFSRLNRVAPETLTFCNDRVEMIASGDPNGTGHSSATPPGGLAHVYAGLSGDHTFTFSARKNSAADGNLNVTASSLTVSSFQEDL